MTIEEIELNLLFWQKWAAVATCAAALFVILAFGISLYQSFGQRGAWKTDQKRYLRESLTIVINALSDKDFHRSRTAIKEHFAHPEEGTTVHNNIYLNNDAKHVLSVYALLSRLVQRNAIDEEIFKDYWQSVLVKDWERLTEFVETERRDKNNSKLYKTAEILAKKWRKP